MSSFLCELPPPGWMCRREVGHDGPCAAMEAGGSPFKCDEFGPNCERCELPGGHAGPHRVTIEWGD